MCVLKLGTPINITMPSASLTPKQCTLTEADISAESSLQHSLDEKKIIAECYKELRVQILERAAEYSKKIDNTTVPTVDNEASSQRYLSHSVHEDGAHLCLQCSSSAPEDRSAPSRAGPEARDSSESSRSIRT